jgi:hypothetical protein
MIGMYKFLMRLSVSGTVNVKIEVFSKMYVEIDMSCETFDIITFLFMLHVI